MSDHIPLLKKVQKFRVSIEAQLKVTGSVPPELEAILRENKDQLLAEIVSERIQKELCLQETYKEARFVRDGFAKAVLELAEIHGWPKLKFKPGHYVPGGQIEWRQFLFNQHTSISTLSKEVIPALRDLRTQS